MKNAFKHNGDGTTIIFHVNAKTGEILETIIDTEDFPKVSNIENSWRIHKNNKNSKYRVKGLVDGKNVYLYRLILDASENLVVDHIDGNTLNNRKSNLRLVTQKINTQNQPSRTDLPRNVVYNARDNKYRVSFLVNGKRKSFGQYHTIEEAEKVAINARKNIMPGALTTKYKGDDRLENLQERVREIAKMLDGKISCWQDSELYWCLKTILLQAEKIDTYEGLSLRHQYDTIIDEMERGK